MCGDLAVYEAHRAFVSVCSATKKLLLFPRHIGKNLTSMSAIFVTISNHCCFKLPRRRSLRLSDLVVKKKTCQGYKVDP